MNKMILLSADNYERLTNKNKRTPVLDNDGDYNPASNNMFAIDPSDKICHK